METVNQRLFKLLGGKRGSQKELADYIGISDSTINKWKTRGSDIPSEYIPKIAEFLGVSKSYLLTGKEEAPFEGANPELIKFFKKLQENNIVDFENLTDEEGERLYNTFKVALEVQKTMKK